MSKFGQRGSLGHRRWGKKKVGFAKIKYLQKKTGFRTHLGWDELDISRVDVFKLADLKEGTTQFFKQHLETRVISRI